MHPYLDNSILTAGEWISQQKISHVLLYWLPLEICTFFMHVAEGET